MAYFIELLSRSIKDADLASAIRAVNAFIIQENQSIQIFYLLSQMDYSLCQIEKEL